MSFGVSIRKKRSKQDAIKAWNKLSKRKDFNPEAIIADVMNRNQNDAVFMGDKQFIPNASTYLNGSRWDDEITEPKEKKTMDIKSEMEKSKSTVQSTPADRNQAAGDAYFGEGNW